MNTNPEFPQIPPSDIPSQAELSTPEIVPPSPASAAPQPARQPFWKSPLQILGQWMLMTLLSLGSITTFLVNGWLTRITRLGALAHFHRAARKWVRTHPSDALVPSHSTWKEWKQLNHQHLHPFQPQNQESESFPVRMKRVWKSGCSLMVSGFRNWIGVFTWTLPGLLLMWFAWYAGWQVSFHKMYEYSGVGAGLGLAGLVLLTITLPMVLMAMARFAVTQDWKVFFQARRNWRWVRRAGLRNISIACLFVLASFPAGINYFVFYFWPDIVQIPADATPEKLHQIVNRFYFMSSLLVLMPAWLLTRYGLGRHYYAPTITRWLARNRVSADDLHAGEIAWLQRAGWPAQRLLDNYQPPPLKGFWNQIRKFFRTVIPVASILMTGLLWLAFSFLIMVAQFGRYSGLEGWFNHPMIHNPHYHFKPNTNPAPSDAVLLNSNPAFTDPVE